MSQPLFRLQVVHGPDAGRTFVGTQGTVFRIGRGTDSHSLLTDTGVSRLHCELIPTPDCVLLMHRSRTAPTLVNGREVVEHRLVPGDSIQVAETVLNFFFVGAGDDPTHPPAKDPSLDGTAEFAQQLVGTALHKYRLESLLSTGSTGAVYRARLESEADPLAVKILWPHVTRDEAARQRFVRAMKTMYPIRHPHIIRIDNAGYTSEFCWVAMDYVDGENLRQLMSRLGAAGRLDWQTAYRIAVHIGRALDAAHQHQVVHRNILPKNILVRRSDKSALLGDLMLAKAMESEDQQITRPGQMIGTVAYMAPERTSGLVATDGRSDIYSLGATLYELVTGRPPFQSESLATLLSDIRQTAPARPKNFQLSIHDGFEGLLLSMLAKSPDDRPQTAARLLKELEAIGRMAGVSA